jgi:hypothetical protein
MGVIKRNWPGSQWAHSAPFLVQKVQLQRVALSGVKSISNLVALQWQLPEMGITELLALM